MEDCIFCKELNEEPEEIDVSGIRLSLAGYYKWHCPIIFCPACGTKLEKYSNKHKED